jgi:alkylation response protein AidB-like acyl-CoA dehydrogenase
MDFTLTDTQNQFRDAVSGFAERHLADDALKRAHSDDYPLDVAKLLADQGLMGITVNEADGGQGGSLMDAVIAIETVAACCPRSADVVQAGNFGAIRVLAEFGTPEQKEKHLQPLLAGETVISLGMSEPEAGSAVTELKTTATIDGDGFRLNGTKVFSSHSLHADVILAYVRFGPGTGGIGSVLVDQGSEGMSLGNPVRYLGGDEWAQIYFEDVYIPSDNVILGPGGFKRQIAGFNVERLGNASRSLALGKLAFEIARDHAAERKQFGRPICEFQGLQWKFSDMLVELEAAQLLLYRAAVNADAGFPSARETSIAKLACNRAGFNAANEALQVMGATGYSEDSLVEYCFRRTRGWMIAGGSLEMMRNRIAESIFDRRFDQRPPKPAE